MFQNNLFKNFPKINEKLNLLIKPVQYFPEKNNYSAWVTQSCFLEEEEDNNNK